MKQAVGLKGNTRMVGEKEYKRFIKNKVAFYLGMSTRSISPARETLKNDITHYLLPKSYGLKEDGWDIVTKTGKSIWDCKHLLKVTWNKRNKKYYLTSVK